MAIFVYGYFLLADTNFDSLPNNFSSYKQLRACYLSDNCALMSTLGFVDDIEQQNDATQSCTTSLMYSLIDASILSENHVQIKLISAKFGLLFSMLTALKTVIKEMEELWEDILVEMDQKFQIYALEKYNRTSVASGNNDESGVSAKPGTSSSDALVTSSLVHDFIQLYAIGSCSDHFKTFLIHELTEKGLKKLEASVENYYSNIQRLLCGNFHQ
jgi:anaphase-promoting complex subunit 4